MGKAKEGSEGFDPDQRAIKEIENEIMKRLGATAPERGVYVRWVDIREIRIREDVLEKLLDWWGAEWEKRIAIREAEGERDALVRKAEGEADAIRKVERAKLEIRGEMLEQIAHLLKFNEKVAIRFIKIMEKICRDMTADDVAGRRYIEVLEAIAKSDGQKTIVIGGDRQLLWPGRRIAGALEELGDRSPDDQG